MTKTAITVDEPPDRPSPSLVIDMADKDEFIRSSVGMFGQAIILTKCCIAILSTQHNACLNWIDPMIFYNRYVGQLVEHSISGKQPKDPEVMVTEAIGLYRPEYLGLKAPGRAVVPQILACQQEWIDVVRAYGVKPAD